MDAERLEFVLRDGGEGQFTARHNRNLAAVSGVNGIHLAPVGLLGFHVRQIFESQRRELVGRQSTS